MSKKDPRDMIGYGSKDQKINGLIMHVLLFK